MTRLTYGEWKASKLKAFWLNATRGLRSPAAALMLATVVWNGGAYATMPVQVTLDDELQEPGLPSHAESSDEATLTGGERAAAEKAPGSSATDLGASGSEVHSPICVALAQSALANDVPLNFFTRLIWQESRFNPRSVSRAGALGIAQFMPETARLRGLTDPFNPKEALLKSAEFLRDLISRFGNPGLAAAAYNAGPGRVIEWLAGRKDLPSETTAYVRIVTGHEAADWSGPQTRLAIVDSPPCETLATRAIAEHAGAKPERTHVVHAVQDTIARRVTHRTRFPASVSVAATPPEHRHIHQAHLVVRPTHGVRSRHA